MPNTRLHGAPNCYPINKRDDLDACLDGVIVMMRSAEFWLLTLVAELWYPVGLLAADNLDEILNTEDVHGLSRAALAEVLGDLFRQGDIIAKRLGTEATFQPTHREL